MFFLQRKWRIFSCYLILLIGLSGVCGDVQALAAPSKDKGEVNQAEGNKKQQMDLETLNKRSDQMYRKAEQCDPLATLEDLRAMQRMLAQLPLQEMTTATGIDTILATLDHAINVFSVFRFQPENGIEAAAQVRYMTDALSHKLHPLWNEAYSVIMDDLRRIYTGVKQEKRIEADAAFANLMKHYTRIQPAVQITKNPEEIKPVQNLLTLTKAQLRHNPYAMTELTMSLDNLRKETNILFGRDDKETLGPVYVPEEPILWTILLGSIILLTLTYSAIRMYQSQQTTIKSRKKSGESGWE
ncbi:sporulation protein YpjB [Paenibacillus sp. N1-5-1-14]|uniref:sporulation protein YpjB n=1 Tax=Paenibacillus radicibacter TaxID=2972488 RepID=UPI0021599D4C|nr:sporulation protein YpjB [Paenibacillus radicibacter]MCR8642260.1 sporulation protein YpjB [Paenibacillus radicibacter]